METKRETSQAIVKNIYATTKDNRLSQCKKDERKQQKTVVAEICKSAISEIYNCK